MQHRIADHHIREPVRESHLFDQRNLEVLRWKSGIERSRKPADMVNAPRIRVHCEDFAALARQVNEVPSVAASGVEHAHARGDVSAQNLIEDVNIDLAELLLDG